MEKDNTSTSAPESKMEHLSSPLYLLYEFEETIADGISLTDFPLKSYHYKASPKKVNDIPWAIKNKRN